MNTVAIGVACVWLGMVLAISFLEAPLDERFADARVTPMS